MDDEPFLEPGQKPPGRWLPGDGKHYSRRWEGPTGWATHHGPAVCHWFLNAPSLIERALAADGRRISARGTMLTFELDEPSADGVWHRPDGNCGWIAGMVALSDADAVFTDLPAEPSLGRPRLEDGPDLSVEMASSASVRDSLADDGLALAVILALPRHSWRKRGTRGAWSCSPAAASDIVARLRPDGRGPPDLSSTGADARAIFGRIGWHPLSSDEIVIEDVEATRMLSCLVSLSRGETPAWYRRLQAQPAPGLPWDLRTIEGQMHRLAATGRATEAEWRYLRRVLDLRPIDDSRQAKYLSVFAGTWRA